MSYSIIHEIKTATVETAGYGYCMKAIFNAIKASIAEAGGTVAETVNTDSATVYNITWVINSRYKVQFYNSGATVYQWNYFGADGTTYRNTNSTNMLTNTAISFTFFYHLYLGSDALEYVISGAGSTVTGWVKNTIQAIITTYTDSNGDTMPLIESQSNGSNGYYLGLARADQNACVRFPTSFYKNASTSISVSAASGSETDEMKMNAWLVPYTTSDNGLMDAYFYGKSISDGNIFLEILDGTGALYLVSNQRYLKIG